MFKEVEWAVIECERSSLLQMPILVKKRLVNYATRGTESTENVSMYSALLHITIAVTRTNLTLTNCFI